MDINKILKFLFPEYQIIESIKEYGFVGKKKNKLKVSQSDQVYSNSPTASYDLEKNPKQSQQNVFERSSNTPIYKKRDLKVSGVNIDEKFEFIRNELSNVIIGQSDFLDNLLIAFKRPFITGYSEQNPRNTMFVLGHENSGRHTIMRETVKLLKKHKLIRYENIPKVDLSLYPTISEKSIFLSDLYKALYIDSDVIVFNSFESCHESFINIISKLVAKGKYKLDARYAFQNNNLVEATGVLMKNSISEISANGKFFIFTTDISENKIVDIFDSKFMNYVGDVIKVDSYTEEELMKLSRRFLNKLSSNCNNNLSMILKYDESLVKHCITIYSYNTGIKGIDEYLYENIYKPLSEYKLRNNIPPYTTVELFVLNETIMGKFVAEEWNETIDLTGLLPKKYTSNLEEIKKELNSIVGLKKVKEYVLSLENNIKVQKMRESKGYKSAPISMHMIFVGNPGTGKTTIARIVAKYLKEIGVLSEGQLKEVSRADLVGQYVGHTAKLTNEVIQSALGGVLFIDEAYSLCRDRNDTFGLEAIDALVKGMEDNRDDLVVILAGYKDEMGEFLKSNSGLKSRFPNIIEFEDYPAEEMYEIANVIAKSKGYCIDEDCKKPLISLFERNQIKGKKDNGNGRMVRNIIESAILEQSKRIINAQDSQLDLLICEDFKFEKPKPFDLDKALEQIVGLDEVKSFIKSLSARLRLQNERKKLNLPVDDSLTLHMIFKGNPGTGKTMIARIIADVLYNIGVTKTNKLIETDRAGLVAGYVGQTAMKTTEKVMEAMDGVLFVDEAYSLSQGGVNDFGKEAIDTLVKLMDDYRDRLVVILAGYSNDMEDFLKVNSGLRSRFPNIVEFKDYNIDELMKIADMFYMNKGYALSKAAKDKLSSILSEASKENSFGNGRYVRNIFERSVNKQALRLSTDMNLTRKELITIEAEDIERI